MTIRKKPLENTVGKGENVGTQLMKFAFDRVENIVGKEENAWYQHFLLFPRFLPCQRQISSAEFNLTLYRTMLTFNHVPNNKF